MRRAEHEKRRADEKRTKREQKIANPTPQPAVLPEEPATNEPAT